MADIRKAIITFSKAQCSAWVATAVDFALTLFLVELCGLWYGYATFIGALAGGSTNCSMRYLLVWGISILLNTVGTCQLTEALRIDFIIVKAVVAVLVAVLWNYQMQRVFVFHANKNKNNIQL